MALSSVDFQAFGPFEQSSPYVPFDPGGLTEFPEAFSVDAAGNIITGAGGAPTPAPQFQADVFGQAPEIALDPGSQFWVDEIGNIFNENGVLVLSATEVPPDIAADVRAQPSTQPQDQAFAYDPRTRAPLTMEEAYRAAGFEPPGTATSAFQPAATEATRRGTVESFLGSRTGALLTTLGLGGAGIGLGQLFAGGDQPAITIPQPPQTAGQKALSDLFEQNPAAARALQEAVLGALEGGATAADVLSQELDRALVANAVEEPARSLIRNESLENLLAMQQGQPPRDPVTAALRRQLLSITAEGTTNPLLQRLFREERDRLQNRMFRAQGPQWQQTTPGIDAATKLAESEAIQTYTNWLNTMGALTGPYQTGLMNEANRSLGLTRLGLPDVPATVSALGSIANPATVGGMSTTNQAALETQRVQDLAAFRSAIATQQAREGLGGSIAKLLGEATGSAFRLAA